MKKTKLLLPAFFALIAHVLAFKNGFVLDDNTLIIQNPYCRTLSGLKVMMTSSLFAASAEPLRTDYYRPISATLNWLSYRILGENAPAQHLLNVAMHMGLCALLARVVVRFGGSARVALAAATLFAVHPGTADIVAYLGGRQDILGWIIVLAWLAEIPQAMPPVRRAAMTLVVCVAAIFCRESFVIALLIFPVTTWLSMKDDKRALVATISGSVVALATVFAIRRAVGVEWFVSHKPMPIGTLMSMGGALSGRLVKDAIFPSDLVVDLTLTPASVALVIVVLAGWIAAGTQTYRYLRNAPRSLALSMTGFLFALAIVAVHTPVAVQFSFISDRYAYPFILSVTLWLAPIAFEALKKMPKTRLETFGGAMPYVLAVAIAPMTWGRVIDWSSETTLQSQMWDVRPDDPQSKFAKGKQYFAQGEFALALPLCKVLYDLHPDEGRAAGCVGVSLLQLGRPKEAIAPLRVYAAEHLANPNARRALLAAMFQAGDLDGVARTLEEWRELADEPEILVAKHELDRLRKPR